MIPLVESVDTSPQLRSNRNGVEKDADPTTEFMEKEQSNFAGLEDEISDVGVLANGIDGDTNGNIGIGESDIFEDSNLLVRESPLLECKECPSQFLAEDKMETHIKMHDRKQKSEKLKSKKRKVAEEEEVNSTEEGSDDELAQEDNGKDESEVREEGSEPPKKRQRGRLTSSNSPPKKSTQEEDEADEDKAEDNDKEIIEPLHQMKTLHSNFLLEKQEIIKRYTSKRESMIEKIPKFWFNVIVNHPQISKLVREEEKDCLHFLKNLEVEEFEDVDGFRLKFIFDKNPFVDNDELVKEIRLGQKRETQSTAIKWKREIKKKLFFKWLVCETKPDVISIAEIIKDDLWLKALRYYSADMKDGDDEAFNDDESMMNEYRNDESVAPSLERLERTGFEEQNATAGVDLDASVNVNGSENEQIRKTETVKQMMNTAIEGCTYKVVRPMDFEIYFKIVYDNAMAIDVTKPDTINQFIKEIIERKELRKAYRERNTRSNPSRERLFLFRTREFVTKEHMRNAILTPLARLPNNVVEDVKQKLEQIGRERHHKRYPSSRHLSTHAPQRKNLQCSKCAKRFLTSSRMRVHKRRVHLQTNLFECVFCEKQFPDNSKLAPHLVRHVKERGPPQSH